MRKRRGSAARGAACWRRELRPLARIASGGELARTALAVKGQLAGADRVPLLAFDEIDADVGPRLGSVIGRRLADLAAAHPVLVITHLPQVAAQGDHHLVVEKTSDKTSATAQLSVLDGNAKVEEIARMLGGVKITEQSRAHAEEMLAAN